MDPNFKRDAPGQSPMGMDLIPVYEGGEPKGDPSEVTLSAEEINAIGVRTAVARVEPVAQRIETVGFVRYDEHRTSHVHTRVEGWIENLKVRAIGDEVAEGELLMEIYAPEIRVGSMELVRAMDRRDRVEIANARRKLANLGMSERQVEAMVGSGEPAQNLEVYAPQNGVVIALDAADGMYLQPDVRALSLADLSSVWLVVDVFERDVGRLEEGKTALARFEHLPGQIFEGVIDYIYPELDRSTRTLPVRLRFDNADGRLKPNMYGAVTLVPRTSRDAVTVPTEAVIRTGRAERVILKVGEGRFRPRLVTTGLTDSFDAGGRTEIVQGLAPGEEVVASAQFLIDSESALNAGLMRMAPTDEEPARGAGVLVSLDRDRSVATIRHEPIEALDWPELETAFTVRADVVLDSLEPGAEVDFSLVRGADSRLALTQLRASDGIDATGTGIVEAVTSDGKLTLSHDPIPELSWPAMTMDLPVRDLDLEAVPVGVLVAFDLVKGDGGLYDIVAVRSAEAPKEPISPLKAESEMQVVAAEGSVNTVDAAAGTASVTHGPLVEIGMPGMTMDFPLAPDLDPTSIAAGPAKLSIGINASGEFVLIGVEALEPPMRVTGTVNRIDTDAARANITHGPLAEIGMPGMTMDFAMADDVEPNALPVGEEVTLLLRRESDFSLTLVGVEGAVTQ